MLVRQILETKGADRGHRADRRPPSPRWRRLLADHGVGALVVSDDGETIAGIVSERDLARAIARQGADALGVPVTEAMTSEVQTCGPDDTID